MRPAPCPSPNDGRSSKLKLAIVKFEEGRFRVVLRRNMVARFLMCRNIKTLHNFKPPATEEEIRASALQFVRKLSGFIRPSKANQLAFDRAVAEVARTAHELLDALVTTAPPRDREIEAAKARAKGIGRFRSAEAEPGV
jgi:hypothetical protein